MFGIVRSELLKMKHTFSMKLIFAAPFATLLLGYLLSGNSVQYAVYNWWYTIIFPMAISVWCAGMVREEKNTAFQNILCLPIHIGKIWIGKNLAVILFLFVTNFLMWAGCTVVGYFTTLHITPANGMAGCMLLFLAYIWQVPFIMFLSDKTGYLPAILLSFAGNVLLFSVGVEKPWFFLNLYAIPSRIVCPFFGIYPNGLLLENGSPLWNTDCILPAVMISLGFAIFVLVITTILFSRKFAQTNLFVLGTKFAD